MDELISIIVPVYNAERHLAETIACVRAQTCREWELLLVEDGSADGSLAEIRRCMEETGDSRIRLICQPSNMGAARARNRGLAEARGRYIAYLDADDLWVPEKLEKELRFLRDRDAAFAFTGYEFADGQGRGTGKVVHVPETLSYRQALSNTTIFTSTVMFDTGKIERSLLEMPTVKSEDTALWFRGAAERLYGLGAGREPGALQARGQHPLRQQAGGPAAHLASLPGLRGPEPAPERLAFCLLGRQGREEKDLAL